jgi:hypothetical protein
MTAGRNRGTDAERISQIAQWYGDPVRDLPRKVIADVQWLLCHIDALKQALMTAGRNIVAEEVEALIMKSAFEDYVKSHGLLGPMDPDARRQKRNAFVAGWKASRRAAAEPEDCATCGGKRKVTRRGMRFEEAVPCPTCAAAEPEAKEEPRRPEWDPFAPMDELPEDIRRDTVTEKGRRR